MLIRSYIILFITLCLSSCSSDFFINEVDLPEEQFASQVSVVARLVNADFDNSEILEFDSFNRFGILVTETASILGEADFELIKNASIALIDGQGIRTTFLFNEETGYYFPEDFITTITNVGQTFTLEVDVPGMDLITSTVEMPSPVDFEIVEFEQDNINIDDDFLDRLEFRLNGIEETSFFELRAHYEFLQINEMDTFIFFDETEVFSFDSSFGDGAEMFSVEPSESGRTFEFWADQPNFGSPELTRVVFSLWTISEEEYRFTNSLENNRNAGGNPFVEPAILFDNIENGVGAFTLSYIQTVEFELE